MSTIPTALEWMFPEGYTPWSSLPYPGTTPSVITIFETLNVPENLIIDEGEVLYSKDSVNILLSSWDMPYIENYGTIWIEHVDRVTAVSSGNINVFQNFSVINAFSSDGDARGVFFGSWGVLQNAGEVNVASYSRSATGYISYSSSAWDRVGFHKNSGSINVWSGLDESTGVTLANGGRFDNSGSLSVVGYQSATAIIFFGDAIINNTGEITADSVNTPSTALQTYSSDLILNNSGIIAADFIVANFDGSSSRKTITNTETGQMFGDISSSSGKIEITNAGYIEGNYNFGLSDDVYESVDGGLFVGTIDFGRGNDRAIGGSGNETFLGGAGIDTLSGGAGADYLDGGTGSADWVDYRTSGSGVAVELHLNQGRLGDAEGDTIFNVENVYGSNFGDLLVGNEVANILSGEDGIDRLNGREGDDTLLGGAGDDFLDGGLGRDLLDGGEGDDTAIYGSVGAGAVLTSFAAFGGVVVNLSDADFTYAGETIGAGTVREVDGTVETLISIEHVEGVAHNFVYSNLLIGSLAANRLTGGVGDDVMYGQDGDDVLNGSWGDDRLFGNQGDDFFLDGRGNDVMNGGAGFDTVSYQNANFGVAVNLDSVAVGSLAAGTARDGEPEFPTQPSSQGLDTLIGIEFLIGSDFGDVMYGSAGRNQFTGGDGDDLMRGRGGDDTLIGGAGDDDLNGQSGEDTADYSGAGAGIEVDLVLGTALDGEGGTDTLVSIERIVGSSFGDTVNGSTSNDRIFAGDGADFVFGREGNDLLFGGAEVDELHGDEGTDRLYGEDGDDYLYGGAGRDVMDGGAGADYMQGDDGEDRMFGRDGGDEMHGGAGFDILNGQEGNDRLFGGDDRDILRGQEGDDTLSGDAGDDRLIGGDGVDTAVFAGNLADFVIILRANGILSVEDTNLSDGDEGRDVLTGVEFLQFSDGVVDVAGL